MRYKLETKKANLKAMRFGLRKKIYHFMKEIYKICENFIGIKADQ